MTRSVAAQTTTVPPVQPAPPAAEPVPAIGETAPPVTPAPASPSAPVPPPPIAPPPPPPSEPPPPPSAYGRLGGAPEAVVQEGDWNPWDHPQSADDYAHQGFFLRLQIGPGGGFVSSEHEDFSGAGLGMGLAIGGSVVPNLALHVDLQTTWLLSPDWEVDGRKKSFDANIGLQSLGLGVTYYFMPVDIFLSGSVGIGRLAFETDDGETKETSAGITGNLIVGKEWWVGADWGIGVGAQLLLMRVKDYVPAGDSLNALAINILFTATYN